MESSACSTTVTVAEASRGLVMRAPVSTAVLVMQPLTLLPTLVDSMKTP